MSIIAIDPGLVTGVALIYEDDRYPVTYEIPGGITGFVEWWSSQFFYTKQVLIEDWMVRPNTYKMTPQPDAYLIIGYMQGKCIENGVPLMKIGPSEHKSFNGKGKKMKTRRLGWGERSKDNHHEDACSVLLLGMTRCDTQRAHALLKEIVND